MKKIILFTVVFSLYFVAFGTNPEKNDSIPAINQLSAGSEISEIDNLGEVIENPQDENKTASPGKIPSFWWSFVLSAIGSYTIYGIGLGPLSVLIVYFSSGKDKIEVRKSIWGWISGTVAGLGVWALMKLK